MDFSPEIFFLVSEEMENKNIWTMKGKLFLFLVSEILIIYFLVPERMINVKRDTIYFSFTDYAEDKLHERMIEIRKKTSINC